MAWTVLAGLGLAEALCSFPPPLPRLAGDLPARLDRAVSSGLGCGSLDFVEVVAERIIWEGLLFNPDADEEEPFLADADSSYERCPGALLLAILSCAARATEKSLPGQADAWNNAFAAWNSLPWTQPLAWHNLQDPLLRPALYAAVSQSKVLAACLQRPADVCSKVVSTLVDHLARAAGLSLSVAADGFVNLPGYGELGLSMLVMANYPHLLEPDVCVGARLMAHLFTARRLLDLKPFLAEHHVYAAQELTRKLMRNGTLYPEYAGAVNTLGHGLEVQQHWLRARAEPVRPAMPEVRGTLRTLSIWEPSLDPVFSESLKDPVLERIFALVDVSNGYYVEVGTQSGEQCNTRYLRVRYGFTGLLIDDNFQNAHVNQRRHFITPRNVVDTFRERGVPQHFDLLSLDTDGFEWLLWLKLLAAGYSPRVVVLEYGENLPFAEDVLIRYSSFPIHRSCLSRLQRFARISGGSILSILRLGLAWGYHLIHVVACGTSDLIFVRGDVLEAKDLSFPAADDPAGLCALAAFQCGAGKANCQHSWPWPRPSQELLATAADVLAGDFLLPDTPAERLLEVLC